MPWFLVDDRFNSHPVILRILATKPEALGLWTAAGAWSSAHLTNGVVRDDVLPQLFPDAAILAKALVTARAWKRVRGGYEFIQEGVCKIPSSTAVENERKAAAERQRRRRQAMSSRRDSGVTHGAVTEPQSNPDPSSGSVINHVTAVNGRASPDLIELIMKEILDTTGRHITAEWAQRTYEHILAGRTVASPAAYLKQAIRNEPDPKKRFLPLY